jgi:hypothetical protein
MSKQQTLEKWLPKPRNRKNRLVIYDFDGTLFNSPDREAGELSYLEATGNTLPFPGWWGRLESLSPPIVPEKPGEEWLIADTITAYREDFKDEETELVLMTGRPFKNRKRVIAICEHFDLIFHGHYFRGQPGQKGRDTLEIKSNFITEDLMHEGLTVLEIWEDRPEHTSAFFTLAKRWKSKFTHLERIVIHDVLQGTSIEV